MDSDSEDDPDYVPPNDNGGTRGVSGSSSDGSDNEEPVSKRPRTTTGTGDDTAYKKTGEEVYAAFKASLTESTSQTPLPPAPAETVKIVKRFRFAGEEITEVKEVPADSDEARKWPLWSPTSDAPSPPMLPNHSAKASAIAPSGTPPESNVPPKPLVKRPGPRKGKSKLADIPTKEPAKRLTTLDKSAMDWRAHVEGDVNSGMKDELEANRRGGGYLEKVEFLQRVETRKDGVLDANQGKRRR